MNRIPDNTVRLPYRTIKMQKANLRCTDNYTSAKMLCISGKVCVKYFIVKNRSKGKWINCEGNFDKWPLLPLSGTKRVLYTFRLSSSVLLLEIWFLFEMHLIERKQLGLKTVECRISDNNEGLVEDATLPKYS